MQQEAEKTPLALYRAGQLLPRPGRVYVTVLPAVPQLEGEDRGEGKDGVVKNDGAGKLHSETKFRHTHARLSLERSFAEQLVRTFTHDC